MKKIYLAGLSLALACPVFGQELPAVSWDVFTIKDQQQSAAFIDIADLDKNGQKEIILSTLQEIGGGPIPPKGALRSFSYQGQTPLTNNWNETIHISTDENLGFVNQSVDMDVNGDGKMDILVQQGFLATNGGSYFWLEGPDFETRHLLAEEDFFWHETAQVDLDNDGLKDLITTSANTTAWPFKKRVEWYRNLGNNEFEQHIINDNAGGVFLKTYDVDGDQDEDIVVSQFFGPPAEPSLVWLEQVAPPSSANQWIGEWTTHTIDATTGLGFHIEFYDIDADGTDELVYDNHNNLNNELLVDANGNKIESGVYWFEIPDNPGADGAVWEKHVIDEHFPVNTFDFGNPATQGSPGVFAIGDVDNNGFPDIVLPGDGTQNLFLLRQKPDHTFVRETIAKGTMFGMALVDDLDGDGTLEIVASMHNFPENFDDLSNYPKGHLKIYKPVVDNSNVSMYLFPNPVVNTLYMNTNAEGPVYFTLVNRFGWPVYIRRIIDFEKNVNYPIDLSNLYPGRYFLKVKAKDVQKKIQLIKE